MTKKQYKALASKRSAQRRACQTDDKPPTLKEMGITLETDYEEAKQMVLSLANTEGESSPQQAPEDTQEQRRVAAGEVEASEE